MNIVKAAEEFSDKDLATMFVGGCCLPVAVLAIGVEIVRIVIRIALMIFAVHLIRIPLPDGELLQLHYLVHFEYVQSLGLNALLRCLPLFVWVITLRGGMKNKKKKDEERSYD